VKARELSDGDVLDGPGEPYGGSTDCCYHGGNWPSVKARGSTCRKVGRHMEAREAVGGGRSSPNHKMCTL